MAAPYYHRADAVRSFLSPEFAVDFIIVDCHTIPRAPFLFFAPRPCRMSLANPYQAGNILYFRGEDVETPVILQRSISVIVMA